MRPDGSGQPADGRAFATSAGQDIRFRASRAALAQDRFGMRKKQNEGSD